MGAIGTAADIGIRVFLDDAASGGLLRIDQAMKDIGDDADKGSGKVANMVGKMAAMGALVGAIASLALFTAAIKYSVDAASEFQQAMFSVAVATHVPMQAAMQYTNQLMNLAAGSIYSSTQIADGIVLLGRSGYSIQDIMGKAADGMHGMAAAGVALGIATRSTATEGFQLLAQTMSAYRAPASQAMLYANLLQFAFEHQTGSVAQLSSALGQVAPAIGVLKTPFQEVASALDVIGPIMGSTSKAGTALRYALSSVTQPTAAAQTEMVKLGLASVDASGNFHSAFFNANGSAKDLTQIVQLLSEKLKGMSQEQQLAALKDIFSVRGGQGMDILLQQFPKYLAYMHQIAASNNNAGGAMARWQQVMGTFGGAMSGLGSSIRDLGVVIGLQILPYLTAAATAFNRFVSFVRTAANGSSEATGMFLKFGMALSVLAVIAAVVIMVMMGVAVPFLVFAGVAIGTVVAIVALAAGLTILVMWVRNVMATCTPLSSVFRGILGVFRDIATFAIQQFSQAFRAVQQAMAPLGPAFSQLGAAVSPFRPFFGALAVVLGAILVGAIHGLIGALSALIQGFALLLVGVIRIVTGILTIFSGLFLVLKGIFDGNMSEIRAGWQAVWNGIVQISQGTWNIIMGLFTISLGAIIGFVAGFVHGVVSFFQWLAGILVGHSIVPDMMNAIRNVITTAFSAILSAIAGFVSNIVSRFIQLGSQVVSTATNAWNMFRAVVQIAMSAAISLVANAAANMISRVMSLGSSIISSANNAWNGFRNAVSNGINAAIGIVSTLPGRILGILSAAAGAAFNGGANIIHAIANGIQSAIGAVAGAIGNVANFISSHLPHSPAKLGPLRELPYQSAMIARQIAEGIQSGTPSIQGALNRAFGGVSSIPSMVRTGTPTMGIAGGGGGGGTQTINLVLDGRVVTQVVLNNLNGQMQMNGLGRAFR